VPVECIENGVLLHDSERLVVLCTSQAENDDILLSDLAMKQLSQKGGNPQVYQEVSWATVAPGTKSDVTSERKDESDTNEHDEDDGDDDE
jgi:hypothetical protein